jgi:hypothetical protein
MYRRMEPPGEIFDVSAVDPGTPWKAATTSP